MAIPNTISEKGINGYWLSINQMQDIEKLEYGYPKEVNK